MCIYIYIYIYVDVCIYIYIYIYVYVCDLAGADCRRPGAPRRTSPPGRRGGA